MSGPFARHGSSGKDSQPPGRPDVPQIGSVAPDFQIPNASQQPWHLDERVNARPVILLFYRGYW